MTTSQPKRSAVAPTGWMSASIGVAVLGSALVAAVTWRFVVSDESPQHERHTLGESRAPLDGENESQEASSNVVANEKPVTSVPSRTVTNELVGDLKPTDTEEWDVERPTEDGLTEEPQDETTDGPVTSREQLEIPAELPPPKPGEAAPRSRDTGLVFAAPADPAFDPAARKPDSDRTGEARTGAAPAPEAVEAPTFATVRDAVENPVLPDSHHPDLDTGLIFTAPSENKQKD